MFCIYANYVDILFWHCVATVGTFIFNIGCTTLCTYSENGTVEKKTGMILVY